MNNYFSNLSDKLKKIDELKSEDEKQIQASVLVKKVIDDHKLWDEDKYWHPSEKDGFSIFTVCEEGDRSLCLVVQSWLPGRGTLPHTHGTWAVIGGVAGIEENNFYAEINDINQEKIDLVPTGTATCAFGDTIKMKPNEIHAFKNITNEVNLSVAF